MQKYLNITLIFMLAGALAACGGPRNPDDHARWFFEKGEKFIVKSLEKQEVPEVVVEKARKVIEQHRQDVTGSLSAYLGSERELLQAIVAGKATEDLVSGEEKLHQLHVSALTAIGKMHEDLSATVGKEKWLAASNQRQEKFKRHME